MKDVDATTVKVRSDFHATRRFILQQRFFYKQNLHLNHFMAWFDGITIFN